MNFYSPYPQMTSDAARIPDDVNAKLFMRHSIRFENPPDGNYDALLLTQEGIELAKEIIQRLLDIPEGDSELFPYDLMDERNADYLSCAETQ